MTTKPEANYNNSLIYKLECKTDPSFLYVGGTTNLSNRKYQLKIKSETEDSNKYSLYFHIHKNGGLINFSISKIEDYPCSTEIELQARTEYWVDKLDANKFMKSELETNDLCKHEVRYSKCIECQEYETKSVFCRHDRRLQYCKICRLFLTCEHNITKKNCKKCTKNFTKCHHEIFKHLCKECNRDYDLVGDMRICIHKLNKYRCNICKPDNICIHGNDIDKCNICNFLVCQHGKKSMFCKVCPDARNICIHNKVNFTCRQCKENKIKIEDSENNDSNEIDTFKIEIRKIIKQLETLLN